MVNLNLEKYGRMLINGTEVSEYRKGNDRFERSVPLDTTKAALISFYNSRIVKNLFDKDNRTRVTGYFASSGTTWSYASSAYSNKIPCKPNTTYTARYNGNSTQAVLGFGSCSTDAEPSATVLNVTVTRGVRQNNPTINTPVTITTGPNDKWLIVAYNIAEPQNTDMADHLQIEEGSTATPYYPHFSPATVLPHLKAHGTHSKHKAPKLWGQYVPCDGITNAASTSIDTGVKAQDNMEMLVRVKAITGSFYIFQARQTGTSSIYGISGSQSGNTINFLDVTSGISRTEGHIYTIKGTYVNGAVTLYVKDETAGTEDTKTGTTSATFPSPTTIKLFGDGSKVGAGCTVYRAYIKVNGQMAWDMYPAVDVTDGSKVVAYDDVTHAPSVKVSGSFTGGSLIQPIAYAESNGNACVDTDLLLDGSEKWTIKFASLKATLNTPVAGTLNGGTAFTDQNNFCVTYTTATTPARYSIYVDGNAGATNNSWNGGVASDKAWHTIEYFGDVNTAPKIDGVAMTNISAGSRIAVTPSVPWRLFGRATTAKGQGTLTQDGVAIARFTGDTWDYIPVRIGTTVELLDLVNWQFAQRTGTLTAGADIPYSQLANDIITVNTGDLQYGWYGDNMVWFDRPDAIKLDVNFTNGAVAANNDRTAMFIPVTGGKTYSFLVSDELKTAGWYLTQFISDTVEIGTAYAIDGVSTFVNRKGYSDYTMTTDSRTKWIGISLSKSKSGTATYFNQQFMMVESATVPSAIVPKVKGVYTTGSHKLTIGGKNLLVPSVHTADGLTEEVSADGRIHIYGTCSRTTSGYGVGSYNLPAGTYALSCGISGSYGNITSITFNSLSGVTFGQAKTVTKSSDVSSSAGIAIENGTHYDFYITPQIEEGSTATEYQLYIPPITRTIPMLLSEDSFCDTQLDTNNVSEAWAVKVFDGTENWRAYSGRNDLFLLNSDDAFKPATPMAILCSHLEGSSESTARQSRNTIRLTYGDSNFGIYSVVVNDITDVSALKALFASEYAKGTPYILLYPRSTPALSTVAIDKVALTEKATHTVTAEAELAVKSQATYLGKG